MSLLFNMLSRLNIAFLPRSKHLLILWLQSPSTMILEPKKRKSVTVSIVSPSICHVVMGPDAMILVFWMLSFKWAFSLSWPPDVKSWLTGKDPDAGKDWRQEGKGTTEDEMVGWHHWLSGHGFGWTPGVGDGQGGLVYCGSWGRKELDMIERPNWTFTLCFHFHQEAI